MKIRPIELRDAAAVLAIHNAAIEDGLGNLDHRIRNIAEQQAWVDAHLGSHPALVAEDDAGTVIAYAAISPYNDRTGYTPTVENSIYVDATAQGRGVGRALLDALVELAADCGFHSMIARITSTNEPSIRLHAAAGFELVGVEREVARKRGQWFDVTIMQRML